MTASCFLNLEEGRVEGLRGLKISDAEKRRKGFTKGVELEQNLVKENSKVERRMKMSFQAEEQGSKQAEAA